MTNKELHQSIRSYLKSDFATISDVARYTGKSREWVRKNITDDLDYIGAEGNQCRSKRYFIGDIAERIMQIRHS